MIEHHIQRSIAHRLAFSDGLRFGELKPDSIDNKLFNYHLKILVRDGVVEKKDDGLYQLSADGKRLGLRTFMGNEPLTEHAYSVLILVVRRKVDGAWLLYTRNTHPLLHLQGFMHAVPEYDTAITDTARRQLQAMTGLIGEFTNLGSGFFRVFKDDTLESFTHFNMLTCEDAQGDLVVNDERASYDWVHDPDFSADTMIPNSKTLASVYSKGEPFFIEETITT